MELEYRTLNSVDEYYQLQDLDRRTWGMDPVPMDETLTVAKNGGLVIGAFLHHQLVGFSYGFPGFKDGEIYLCSHKLAVLPEFRDRNVGYQLKLCQKKLASDIGYRLIRWTYDPLEARNATLNLKKLGAVSSEYIENCYGERRDHFSADLPTDRLNLDWNVSSNPSKPDGMDRMEGYLTKEITQTGLLLNWRQTRSDFPEPIFHQEPELTMNATALEPSCFLYVPIPTNFQELKQADFSLAREWRFATRRVFQKAFAAGWVVTGILPSESHHVQIYRLSRT